VSDAQPSPSPTPWPPLNPQRIAASVTSLAERADDAALRAQLHALGTVVGCLTAQLPADPRAVELQAALEQALAHGNDSQVVSAARRLAAHHRASGDTVDWSAVSGG